MAPATLLDEHLVILEYRVDGLPTDSRLTGYLADRGIGIVRCEDVVDYLLPGRLLHLGLAFEFRELPDIGRSEVRESCLPELKGISVTTEPRRKVVPLGNLEPDTESPGVLILTR